MPGADRGEAGPRRADRRGPIWRARFSPTALGGQIAPIATDNPEFSSAHSLMPRPRTISDKHIVDAAREVFVEHGFSATTAEIARRAGISEGTLFKRFASKEDIFAQVIGLADLPRWHDALVAHVGQGEVRDTLERFALRFIEVARQVIPRLMMLWSRGQGPPHLLQAQGPLHDDPMRRDLQALRAYLQGEVELGRLRAGTNSGAVAQVIMGALMHRVLMEVHAGRETGPTTPRTDAIQTDAAQYARDLLDVVWPGMAP